MIFEQEVSIFNPNALHSRFTKYDTQIQQTSRNIALIATREELLQSSVSGKSFLETSKGYIDVRADSIVGMVQSRQLGGKNYLFNTGNPTNPSDVDTSGMTQEEAQIAIAEANRDSYKYLVAGANSFTSIEHSTYWNENVFSRTLSSLKGEIYSSRARLRQSDNLYTFSCDYMATEGVDNISIYIRWDVEGDVKSGTGYVNSTLLYNSELDIDEIKTLSYEDIDANGDTFINDTNEALYKRQFVEYETNSSEKWKHIEIPFILQKPRKEPYPNSGFIYFYAIGSNGSKFKVTHLQLEKGGIATSYDSSLDEQMDETYAKIEILSDKITLGFNGNNIISLINGEDTTASIDADRIQVIGQTTFISSLKNQGVVTNSDLDDYLTAEDVGASGTTIIDGGRISASDLTVLSAKIADFNITKNANNGTTSQGGHLYSNSLYAHTTGVEPKVIIENDTPTTTLVTSEYEFGLARPLPTLATNQKVFYVSKIDNNNTWTENNQEDMFYVKANGDMYAGNAVIKTLKTTGTLKSSASSYGLEDNLEIVKFDHLVFLNLSNITMIELEECGFNINNILGENCRPTKEVSILCDVYMPVVTTRTINMYYNNVQTNVAPSITSLNTGTQYNFYENSGQCSLIAFQKPEVSKYGQQSSNFDSDFNTQLQKVSGRIRIDTDGIIHLEIYNTSWQYGNLSGEKRWTDITAPFKRFSNGASLTAIQHYREIIAQCKSEEELKMGSENKLMFKEDKQASSNTSEVWHTYNDILDGFVWQSNLNYVNGTVISGANASFGIDGIIGKYVYAVFLNANGYWITND